MPNELLERICSSSLCEKLIASSKDIWLSERIKDNAGKHLHSNKFMRTADVMIEFLKKKRKERTACLL